MAFKRKFGNPSRPNNMLKIILGIIVIIIIVALALLFFSSSAMGISSPTTLTLSNNQSTYFKLPGSSSTYVIFLLASSNLSSTFYVTGTPVLVKPISSVNLTAASSANVSADGSQTADIQVKLISTKTGSAQVQITPIPTSIQVRPSGSVVVISPSTGSASQTTSATTIVATTIGSSSTITGATTQSTSVASTTTVEQMPTATIIAIANSSQVGALMVDYDELYVRDQACDSVEYNATYDSYFHSAPSGPESFANVSSVTPLEFDIVSTQVGDNLYNVSYKPELPNGENVPAIVTIEVNVTSNTAVGFAYSSGLNFTVLDSQYQLQNSFSGSCGAYIE